MLRSKTAEVSISETSAVLTCNHERHTYRTILEKWMKLLGPKEEEKGEITQQVDPSIPQWMYNLKNHRPDINR